MVGKASFEDHYTYEEVLLVQAVTTLLAQGVEIPVEVKELVFGIYQDFQLQPPTKFLQLVARGACLMGRVDRESPEQKMCFRYMQLKYPRAFKAAFHVPNGGHRNKVTAAKLKAEGVKAGVPDICVAMARGGYYGLYAEMKAKPPYNAAVSKHQKEWLARLEDEGYLVQVCKGFNEFKSFIDLYMGWPKTETKFRIPGNE